MAVTALQGGAGGGFDPLADVVEAFLHEKSGGHVGKICVDI
jgi:hypothetical protein